MLTKETRAGRQPHCCLKCDKESAYLRNKLMDENQNSSKPQSEWVCKRPSTLPLQDLFTSISFADPHPVMQSKRVGKYLLTAAVSWKAGLETGQEEKTKSNNNPKKRSRVPIFELTEQLVFQFL